MRLLVKQNDQVVNEFQFKKGPVNIGRHADSQIFLANRLVSRHHAVIYSTTNGTWFLEDLDSANKTYLNDKPIHKAEIKTGDSLRIIDFTIDINLENDTVVDKAINLDDTLSKTAYSMENTLDVTQKDSKTTAPKSPLEPQIIIRKIDSNRGPDIRLPAKRAKDFMRATEAICKTNSLDELLSALLSIVTRQFRSFHAWCALRDEPTGPMTAHLGKQKDGSRVEMKQIEFAEKINQAVEKSQFLLFPRIPPKDYKEKINSVIIAPIKGQGGCFGVVYLDNDLSHEHYSLSDLDYLMLLAIHTADVIENF